MPNTLINIDFKFLYIFDTMWFFTILRVVKRIFRTRRCQWSFLCLFFIITLRFNGETLHKSYFGVCVWGGVSKTLMLHHVSGIRVFWQGVKQQGRTTQQQTTQYFPCFLPSPLPCLIGTRRQLGNSTVFTSLSTSYITVPNNYLIRLDFSLLSTQGNLNATDISMQISTHQT